MTRIEQALASDFAAIFNGKPTASLLNLSVSKDTQPPTAERRVQELRARLPVERFNSHEWPHCQRAAYEREQIESSF